MSQTKDFVRFHTPRVLELQQDLLTARESRNIASRQAWAELISQVTRGIDTRSNQERGRRNLGVLESLHKSKGASSS